MQELKSCFAPPNYHSDKHVSFAQVPIICTSAPFLWKDEYSDDITFEETEEEEVKEIKGQIYDDDSDNQSTNECSHSFLFCIVLIIFSIGILLNIHFLPSSTFATGLINNLSNTYFFKTILDLII